jgi:hypothetical protein
MLTIIIKPVYYHLYYKTVLELALLLLVAVPIEAVQADELHNTFWTSNLANQALEFSCFPIGDFGLMSRVD